MSSRCRRRRSGVMRTVAWICVLVAWCATAQEQAEVSGRKLFDPEDLARAVKLKLFETEQELTEAKGLEPWDFSQGTPELFTFFSPEVKDRNVAEGRLRFKTSGQRVLLGWGNYENRQAVKDRVFLWPNWNTVELRVKQSAPSSTWTLQLWQDGKKTVPYAPRAKSKESADLEGMEWQTLSFFVEQPAGDGFGLTIEGPADNVVEIDSVRILQKGRRAHFRKVFALPEGRVWKALAEVSGNSKLFVNGKEIPFQDHNNIFYQVTPVDLSKHVRTGLNCVALSADFPLTYKTLSTAYPHVGFLRGRVVMSSGETVSLDTGPGWTASKEAEPGWTEADSNVSWPEAEVLEKFASYSVFNRRLPLWDGVTVIENPYDDPNLFFHDTEPLKLFVRIPSGYVDRSPVLEWVLRRAPEEVRRGAPEPEVNRGEVRACEPDRKTDSLVFTVNAGTQPRGVYSMELSLHAGGELVEERLPEPLAVVGRIPMKEVTGDSYLQGMDLVLEDTIDFTNPADRHAWIETERMDGNKPIKGVDEPRIVTRDGLTYRETAPGLKSGITAHFSYRFHFKSPGSWYLFELDYPDDADRCIGACVCDVEEWGERDASATHVNKSGSAVVTGFKYPLTGAMRTLRWLHVSHSRDQIFSVASLANDRRAAASRLRIYRVREFPALAVQTTGERRMGLHSERARTVARQYALADPGPYQLVYGRKLKLDVVGMGVQRLRHYMTGCENYARYLRFTGQNLHVMGAFQYTENNLSYKVPFGVETSRILYDDIREVALRVFAANGIDLMMLTEYVLHKSIGEKYAASDTTIALGQETVFPVSRRGEQAGGAGCVSQACFDHPAVQDGFLRVVRHLGEKFAWSPSFKGVYVMAFPTFSGPVTYAPKDQPFDYDYSDATIAAFEKETGVKVPVPLEDLDRFEKRYVFLNSEVMRDRWVDWRVQTVRRKVLEARDVLQTLRPDLQVMYGYYLSSLHMFRWAQSGRPYVEFMRDYGWDPTVFRKDRDIWCGRYFFPNDLGFLGKSGYGHAAPWKHHLSPEVEAAYAKPGKRLCVMNTGWHEVGLMPPEAVWEGRYVKKKPYRDWPVTHLHVRFISQPNQENALEKFSQAMIGADPNVMLYGFTDFILPTGYEQQLRALNRVLTALPGERFEPVLGTTDFEHNLAIRSLRKGGATWFYVVNPGYWPISGRVELSAEATVTDPATGSEVETASSDGRTVVPVSLGGFGMAAFKANGRRVRIAAWDNEPVPESELAHVRGILAKASRYMDAPEVAQAVALDDRQHVNDTVARAEAALAEGAYARAWHLATEWKFWTLVFEDLEKAGRYAARIPGYTPQERDPEKLPSLDAVAAGTKVKVDGRLDEAVWAKAPMTRGFLSLGTHGEIYGRPMVGTAAQAAYDEEHLYLAFTMADVDTSALKATAEDPVDVLNTYDDAIAFFVQPDGVKLYQMAVNPAGLRFHSDATGQKGSYRVHENDFGPWQAAVHKTKDVWTVEVAVPFSTLGTEAAAGDTWRVNFLRRYREFLVPEIYWTRAGRTWYVPERYGYLRFR